MALKKKYVDILSCHFAKQHNFSQASELSSLFGKKYKHATSAYFDPGFVNLVKKVSGRIGNWTAKRSHPALKGKFVTSLPGAEIKKSIAVLKKRKPDYFNIIDTFQTAVINTYLPPKLVIGFDNQSNLIFEAWKGKTILLLDLTIGYPPYRLKVDHGDSFRQEMLIDAPANELKLFERYKAELRLADLVLCSSEFVRNSILFFHPEFKDKLVFLPYAANMQLFNFPERIFRSTDQLKFVFVGTAGWRKGADVLLKAWEKYVLANRGAELHFYGDIDQEIDTGKDYRNVYFHRRVGHPELIRGLKEADVLVYPTTFEGSAISLFEAMGLQLPIITTFNSGTVLKHGESCELIEPGNIDQLLAAMGKLAGDPSYRERLGRAAYRESRNYDWSNYRSRLSEVLRERFPQVFS